MKKFRTYGKTKFKKDMRCDEWDDLKTEESPSFPRKQWSTAEDAGKKNEAIGDKVDEIYDVSVLLKDLEIADHSTPLRTEDTENKILLVTPDVTPSKNDITTYGGTPKADPVKKQNRAKESDTPLSMNKGKANSDSMNYNFSCQRSVNFVWSKKNSSVHKKTSGYLSKSLFSDSNVSTSLSESCNQGEISFKEALLPSQTGTDEEQKILSLCEQLQILNIQDYVHSSEFLKKIGEGSYGEVFEKKNDNDVSIAIKIVPVGSKETLLNGYPQMKLCEIIPEMAISRKLSSLSSEERWLKKGYSESFIKLHRLIYCKGKYPQPLTSLWEKYDEENESENDHPEIFTDQQSYIVFETDFGGTDLEKSKLKNFKECLSILHQLVAALASAEEEFEFEHRDLHHGNVLLRKTEEKILKSVVNNKEYLIESSGLQVSIIDFTMARLLSDDCVVFTDLASEEDLFEGNGDIQFDVYRYMKQHNRNQWENFQPYSNVLWLQYITEKLISKIKYTATLKKFLSRISDYTSAMDILENDPLFQK